MDKYKCDKCDKEFILKWDYERHVKRKFPCKKKIIIKRKIEEEIKENNYCNYCEIIFSRKDAVKRHIIKCKIKKRIEKEREDKKREEKEMEDKKRDEIFNKLLDREEKYEIIERENEKLKKEVKRCNIKNYNTNIIQNIIIPSERLVGFGKEDLTKINNNKFLKVMNGNNITGCRIFIELLKLIHFNEEYPEYQNIYITDKNREHYMVYNGNNWELNKNRTDDIIKQIEEISDIKLEEIKEEGYENKYKHIIDKIIKYNELYYNETEKFIKIVDERVKEYLYNNKEIPINNYIKLTNNLLIENKDN